MDEPLIPKFDPSAYLQAVYKDLRTAWFRPYETDSASYLTSLLTLVFVQTLLPFACLSFLAVFSFTSIAFGFLLIFIAAFALIVLILGFVMLQVKKAEVTGSRYLFSFYILSAISEAALCILAGMVTSTDVLAAVLSVSVSLQAVLTVFSRFGTMTTDAGKALIIGVGLAQTVIVVTVKAQASVVRA